MARSMKRVTKAGYEGVYARVKDGRVTGFTAHVWDENTRKKVSAGTHATAKEARDARDRLRRELQDRQRGTQKRMTGHAFMDVYFDEFPHRRASSENTMKYALKDFLDTFGDEYLDKLDTADVKSWGRKTSINKFKAARAFMNHAHEYGCMPQNNPLARMGVEPSRGRADIDIITEGELHELADLAVAVHGPAFGPVIRARILWGAYTMMRPAEVRPLQREHLMPKDHADGLDIIYVYDNQGSTGEITRPKNGQPRHIYMPPPAKRAVDPMPRMADCPYVFPSKSGAIMTKSTEYDYWNPVRKAMAAKTGDYERWAGFDLYELRHFGASFQLNVLRVPDDAIAHMLGHTDADGPKLVRKLYGHPDQNVFNREIASAYEQHEARKAAEFAAAQSDKFPLRVIQGEGA